MTEEQGPHVKKKHEFTWTDWVEGAVLLVAAVLFVQWLIDK
ncbi:hypothetical protein [Streptomyces sp. NPDC014733]